MATVTRVMLTCDVCGNTGDVQTWTLGLDGKTYEIDLCQKDGQGLSKVAAGYVPKARKLTARQSARQNSHRPRSRTAAPAIGDVDRTPGRKMPSRGRAGSSGKKAKPSRSQPQAGKATGVRPGKGIYIYGILPADIEMAAEMPGVGERPGLLRIIRHDGLAALISDVDLSGRLGSPDDLRTHSEILDATAAEVPVLPLRCGMVVASEDAVAEDLLAAHHDEFADALEKVEGRTEFLVRGRYIEGTVPGEVLSEKKQGISEAAAARREEDTRALREAMERVCVDSAVQDPPHELDEVRVAFLVPADKETEVERVVEDLAREWEGRIDIQLLGPMAAYDFVDLQTARLSRTGSHRPG